MLEDAKYIVVKPIPLDRKGERNIKVGTTISVTHGCVYMDGGFLNPDYQDDFRTLIETELRNGFNYLNRERRIVGDSIVGNF